MPPKKTFWTPKRLIELRVKSRTLTIEQLVAHFHRTDADIRQAQIYEANKRRLLVGYTTLAVDGKLVRVALFKAEYAAGTRPTSTVGSQTPLF